MGFKLVRVDATEPCKIPLAVGTHYIGRGKFLDCHDHRVSRNHGQLEVTDDTVRIIALHQNPCFFRRKCSQNTNILPQNEFIELSNGDQFGLVPESYWYELIYCIESLVPPCGDFIPVPVKIEKSNCDEPSGSGSSGNRSQIDVENTARVEPSISQSTLMETEPQTDIPTTSPYKRSHSEGSINKVVKKVKTEPETPCVSHNNESQGIKNENRVTNDEKQAVKSESQAVSNEIAQANVGTSNIDSILDEGIQDTDENETSNSDKETEKTPITVKTEPCSSNTVKTEPNVETVETEPSKNNVKTESNSQDNVKPGPSHNRPVDAAAASPSAAGAADKAGGEAAAPAPPAPAPAGGRPREKCMYGAQCYRVNPAHKAQFSHPGDADWAARVPCRWGAACRDIRPAHWRDHDHPPRRDHHDRRRGGHGVRKKRVKISHHRQRDSSLSDDSSETILTRTRNAGVANNKIIKDESDSDEKDPFASDDTDDWVPSDDD